MRTSMRALAFLLFACGGSSASLDAAMPEDATPEDATPARADATPEDAAPEDAGPTGVEATHERELRAVWLTTVYNLDWPSRSGLSADAQRAELDTLFDLFAQSGFNAVFLQVRPEGDALYRSTLEPWSRYLTGTMGNDPGYDPLADALTAARRRGLELHAWVNPYRALASSRTTAATGHASLRFPEHTHTYGSSTWMDPGASEVQDHVVAVLRELLEAYDVDGLVFDDYFYPYPDGTPYPDDTTFAAYQSSGGTLTRDDWRRDNVNRLVARVGALVDEVRPTARFGISPFGIHRPGMPEGIRGLDAYAAIYADAHAWWDAGSVDWLAPQLYWPSTQAPQAYGALVTWWGAFADGTDGRVLFAANDATRLGSTDAWTLDEMATQIRLTREAPGMAGNIYFRARALVEDRLGLTTLLRTETYASPALPPPTPGVTRPAMPTLDGTTLRASTDTRAFAIYDDATTLRRVLPATEGTATLDDTDVLVTAVGPGAAESLAIEVP
ncbi:MAG: family 10 glycosylhydrolase [Polyangiales bacterium]